MQRPPARRCRTVRRPGTPRPRFMQMSRRMPPPTAVMVPRMMTDDVEPPPTGSAHADHGPQGYRQVVQQVDDGVEIGGQLTEVEHHHARDGAGDDQRRLLERVDTVVLQQDVAHDAAGQTGDNGDARHAEYIVACAHCAHGAGQTAGQRSGKLQPEGDGEGDVQHGALTLRRRAAAARRQRRPRPTPRAPQRVRPRSLARW